MNKTFFAVLVLFLVVQAPIVFSLDCSHYDDYEECLEDYFTDLEEDECGIFNIASCIPEKIYDYFMGIINAPLQPLLTMVKDLLTEPVDVSIFGVLWAIMLYVISIFYSFLMLYSGFNFMLSSEDAVKRAKAKEWFRNIFIMIVLVQASYFIYSAVVEIAGLVSLGVINMIDPSFFLFTGDNAVNIGLQFFFGFSYVMVLILTTIMLSLRYIIVASGVAIVPLAVFLYFIPPLQSYGKLMFNFLGTCMFITFLDGLVLLICSMLTKIPLFASFKILVMISAFSVINILMFYLMFFSAIKSAMGKGEGVVKTVVAVGKYFV